MKRFSLRLVSTLIIFGLMLIVSGCGGDSVSQEQSQPVVAPTEAMAGSGNSTPAVLVTARPLSVPPTSGNAPVVAAALPADPQPVTFTTSDGVTLSGLYYPAAVSPAPIIVLMHWAGGNMHDWDAIAPWLQNRDLPSPESSSAPWLDSSWFPAMPEDSSFGVLIFNFRGFDTGNPNWDGAGWVLDAQAAMATARTLQGADPNRVVAIGASIGADGAPDACAEGCLGTFSLSPGGYLDIPYVQAAEALVTADPPREVWCLASDGDGEAAPSCQAAAEMQNDHIFVQMFSGSEHGMTLLQPQIEPSAMQLMLDFLALVFGS